jgi:uncharacterized protein (UPF0210 family)
MKVRSITAFQALGEEPLGAAIAEVGKLLRAARTQLQGGGVEVQTVRLALSGPLPGGGELVDFAIELEEACRESGVDHVSLGALPLGRLDAVPELIAATSIVFVSASVAGEQGVDWRAVRAAARAIAAIARASADGFGNLRFGALARCPALIPFFPAAYHDGGAPALALALQGADLAQAAAREARSIDEVPAAVARRFDAAAGPLEAEVRRIARRRGRRYAGLDLSPAPFPDDETSLAGAIEAISGARFGRRGTVAAAAAITRGLRQTTVQRGGFSGLMLPVLEDSILARRTAEGSFGLTDLLLASTVCGTGLDTVPLPGDASEEALACLIGEVATLAHQLDKPLTARLLPVPGKRAGEQTSYDFPYFANGRVLPV